MKRLLLIVLAAFTLLGIAAAPCAADVVIDNLLVRRQDDNANIRVQMRNPASRQQKGPVVVKLFARRNPQAPWTLVRTWTDIPSLGAGLKVSRDFFDANNQLLHDLVAEGDFEVRATVTAPGARVESVTRFSDKE